MKTSPNTAVLITLSFVAVGMAFFGCNKTEDAPSATHVSKVEIDASTTKIPFTLTKWNNISVDVALNESDSLKLMFHTGAGAVALTEEAVRKCTTLQFEKSLPTKSWGGQSTSRYCEDNQLSIQGFVFDGVTIYEDVHSGRETDGKFGPGLFDGKIVEIDYEKKHLLIHDDLPGKIDEFEKFTFEDPRNNFYVEGKIAIDNRMVSNQFLIHSGYSGIAMLDDQFVAENTALKSLPVLDESQVTDSFGNVLKTQKINLPSIQLGSIAFNDVPVSIFDGAMGRQKISLVGGDLLKRLDIILDVENSSIYLRKNSLKYEEYFSG